MLTAQDLNGAEVGVESDMTAHIYKLDLTAGTFEEVLSFNMNYRVENKKKPIFTKDVSPELNLALKPLL